MDWVAKVENGWTQWKQELSQWCQCLHQFGWRRLQPRLVSVLTVEENTLITDSASSDLYSIWIGLWKDGVGKIAFQSENSKIFQNFHHEQILLTSGWMVMTSTTLIGHQESRMTKMAQKCALNSTSSGAGRGEGIMEWPKADVVGRQEPLQRRSGWSYIVSMTSWPENYFISTEGGGWAVL